jgi:hypothetical protein
MWSMWNAPSDRDYYDSRGWDEFDEDDEPRYCGHCGAQWDQACEESCYTNAPAFEPPPTEATEREPPMGTTGLSDPVAAILGQVQTVPERPALL